MIDIKKTQPLADTAYMDDLRSYQAYYQQVPIIAHLLEQVEDAMKSLMAGRLPHQLPKLEISDEIVVALQQYVLQQYPTDQDAGNQLWQYLSGPLEDVDYLLRHFRDILIQEFSMYGFVSEEFIIDLADYTEGQPVLEIMAGHGYLSAGLRAVHPAQTIYTTDNLDWQLQPDKTAARPVTSVTVMDALTAITTYADHVAYIVMSWAPDTTEIDWQVLQKLRESLSLDQVQFLVIGEKNGATNSRRFWQEAHLTELPRVNQHHDSFDLIDERIYLVK